MCIICTSFMQGNEYWCAPPIIKIQYFVKLHKMRPLALRSLVLHGLDENFQSTCGKTVWVPFLSLVPKPSPTRARNVSLNSFLASFLARHRKRGPLIRQPWPIPTPSPLIALNTSWTQGASKIHARQRRLSSLGIARWGRRGRRWRVRESPEDGTKAMLRGGCTVEVERPAPMEHVPPNSPHHPQWIHASCKARSEELCKGGGGEGSHLRMAPRPCCLGGAVRWQRGLRLWGMCSTSLTSSHPHSIHDSCKAKAE